MLAAYRKNTHSQANFSALHVLALKYFGQWQRGGGGISGPLAHYAEHYYNAVTNNMHPAMGLCRGFGRLSLGAVDRIARTECTGCFCAYRGNGSEAHEQWLYDCASGPDV
jgi:hypothetical protein